jgi:hypothetical protein
MPLSLMALRFTKRAGFRTAGSTQGDFQADQAGKTTLRSGGRSKYPESEAVVPAAH